MTIGVLVDSDWPFGEAKAKGARSGATKRTILLTIQRHVLDSEAPDSESGGPAHRHTGTETKIAFDGGPVEPHTPFAPYARARELFAERWETFSAKQPEIRELLSGVDEAPGETVPDRLFCLGFYGLCWCLASAGFAALSETEEEEDDEEEGEPPPAKFAAGKLCAERTHAVSTIADLLVEVLPGPEAVGETAKNGRSARNHARLVAKTVLECLLSAMPESFELERARIAATSRRTMTRQRIRARPRLAHRVERLLEKLPYRFTVQPRDAPVCHADVNPGAAENETKIHIPLIGYRRTNRFLANFLGDALKGNGSSFAFAPYVEAVNVQQAVGWRINVLLLRHAEMLKALTGKQSEWSEKTRGAVAEARLAEDAIEHVQAWTREKFYVPQSGERDRKRYRLPGEFLDAPLVRQALSDLAPETGAPKTFYLPWKADYRGRISAETPWLTPQGGDLQRAVLEFARGRALDEGGVRALRRHGAALVRRERILHDLDLAISSVPTLADRERWIEQHEERICASARNPLVESFWRDSAKKPLQFLAFCLAYRQWKQDPHALIHLPVQIDGTCNGLQHIAALTGDVDLARAVNVLDAEDGTPGDIYNELAGAARASFGSLRRDKLGKMPELLCEMLIEADALLERDPRWQAQLDRDVAKAVVMTVPYGAGIVAQTQEVASRFEARLKSVGPDDAMWQTTQRWAERLESNEEARAIASRWTKGSFRQRGNSDQSAAGKKHLFVQRTIGGAVAHVMVHHLCATLGSRYPSVPRFSDWLGKDVAKACEGLPLMWLAPLGFPVCQDGFRIARSTLSAQFKKGGVAKTISIETSDLTEQVAERKQVTALLPNLIHSFDATHLAMMLNAAAVEHITEIGTIHDCLLCHPNDAGRLAAIARWTFCDLYRSAADGSAPAVLKQWSEWMEIVARIGALEHTSLVYGALAQRGGEGERRLVAESDVGGERGAAANKALAAIRDIRALEPPQATLARLLLAYAKSVPFKMKATGVEEQKGPTRALPKTRGWAHGGWGALPLSPESMPEYFFS